MERKKTIKSTHIVSIIIIIVMCSDAFVIAFIKTMTSLFLSVVITISSVFLV